MKKLHLLLLALLLSFVSFGQISGPTSICRGTTATFSSAASGGTWTTVSTSISLGTTGIVYAAAPGVAVISYTSGSGVATHTVTVEPTPTITGSPFACAGGTTSLSATPTGGAWSSSSPSIATVGTGGIVTGVSSGIAVITYTTIVGCADTFMVSIGGSIPTISVPSTICAGTVATVTRTPTGGSWTSSNTAVAIASGGILFGISAGTATLTYTTGCGSATATVSVNPSAAITGPSSFCTGGSITLSGATTGGTWSGGSGIVSVGSSTGIVTGVLTGSARITYTAPGGCISVDTITVSSGGTPSISGSSSLCTYGYTSISATPSGGTWSSSNAAVAKVVSASLVGYSAGTATITYTTACGSATMGVTVMPVPATITGPSSVCSGGTITLATATTGGTWSSASGTLSVDPITGVVTGVTTGTGHVTYTLSTGCYAVDTVSVSTSGTPSISGTTVLCGFTVASISGSPSGGTWSTSNPAVAAVIGTSSLYGFTGGTASITYATTCGSATTVVTVMAAPAAITGPSTVCAGGTITLATTSTGGTWSTPSTTASVNAITGVVTGFSGGFASIFYTLPTGCVAGDTITVTPSGTPTIIAPSSMCSGSTATVIGSPLGGTWSSSSASISTGTPGSLLAVSPGTATITYSLGSCGGAATSAVTVLPAPGAITGPTSICVGASATLGNSVSGGTWSVSGTTVASIGASTGIITGLSTGTITTSYILSGGCMALTSISVVTSPGSVSGPSTVCTGSTITMYGGSTGTMWSSSSPSIASIGTSGVVTGISAGTATLSYYFSSGPGCATTATVTVTAGASVTPAFPTVCIGGTTGLTATPSGGIWSSVGTSASVGISSGIVSGLATGVEMITYVATSGCTATVAATVMPLPTITASAAHASCGSSYTLTAGGGTSYSWAPSTGLSCGTCASATFDPSATATLTVTGTDMFGCVNTGVVSVNGNRIEGVISFTTAGTDTAKVWLVQFNPSDSSINALDSTLACKLSSGTQYYEFGSVPAGNYMVKAAIKGAVPGTSGYMPTYSLASAYWYSAATAAHTSATDIMNINMNYGTVPAGPGFISGYVYLGAGKGTTAGVANFLIYLKDASGKVIAYTYTDATGEYTFGSLAYGTYTIHPEDFQFYTTESAPVVLSFDIASATHISFEKHPLARTITPMESTAVASVEDGRSIGVFPNPANGMLNITWHAQATGNATIVITDIVGREVYNGSSVMAAGHANINVSSLVNGVYHVSVRADNMNYNGKVQIQH